MEIRDNGTVVHDGIAIGRVTEKESVDGAGITLNLGWCEHAGVRVTVQGNPNVEGRRLVLDRAPGAAPSARSSRAASDAVA